MTPNTHTQTIQAIKKRLGPDLVIMGHHYQNDAVLQHTDIQGDSLELARKVPGIDAKYIVFCGVYFMAESAAILAKPGQAVFLPDAGASCDLADMAEAREVREVMERLNQDGRTIIPLTYVNSSAAVKAVVGEFGGSVCTSANARTMLQWARGQGDGVLFLPDRNLANNTADMLDIPESKRLSLHRDSLGRMADVDPAAAGQADLFIWPGYCPVHEAFGMELVEAIRRTTPEAKIIAHPECPPELIQECDEAGSTSFMIKYVREAPEASTIYVGTELNLVYRLSQEYAGKKLVFPLLVSICPDMAKTTEANLASLLGRLETGNDEPVTVAREIAEPALLALERMLAASK